MNIRDALNVIIKLVETKDELTKIQAGLIKQLEAENKKLREILAREVDDGRAEVDDIGIETWIEQALKP